MSSRSSSVSLLLLLALVLASLVDEVTGFGQVEVPLGVDGVLLTEKDLSIDQQSLPPRMLLDGPTDTAKVGASKQESRPPAPLISKPETRLDGQREDEIFTLQAEIDALDDMIRLQEKKLRVLREMRRTGAIGHTATSSSLPEGLRSRDAIERRLDAVEAKEAEDALAQCFETYFVERAVTPSKEGVAAVKILRIPSIQATDLAVLAYTSGLLEFYISPLVKIWEMTLPGVVESIALEMYNQQPHLVVSHGARMVSTYALHLNDNARTTRLLNQTSKATGKLELRVEHIGTTQLDSRVSAFVLAEGVGRIIASCEDGKLSVFSVNGTQIDSIETGTTNIKAVASLQRRMAFSDASDVVITSIGGRSTRTFVRCLGSSDTVTSLAFDQQENDIIYAGTQTGGVLVFRFQWGSSLSDRPSCRLLTRTMAVTRERGGRRSDVSLKIAKGYMMVAGASELRVFNLSRADSANSPSLTLVTALNAVNLADHGTLPFDFAQGSYDSSLILLTADPAGSSSTVKLYHSFLTAPVDQREFPWVFLMYISVALVVVIATQIFARRGPDNSPSPWDAPEFGRKLSYEKHGSTRTSFGLQGASISSRITQNRSKASGYSVGEAFEEAYSYNDAFEEDPSRPTYHSLRDELGQHLATSTRKKV